MSDLRDLYEEVILEHNRNPRHYPKRPEDANREAYGFNPLCGDEFHVYLTVKDNVIQDIGFDGAGCAISTASASLMTDAIIGKTTEEAEKLFKEMHVFLTDENRDDITPSVGKLSVLGGVKEYPMRVKCATLAWHTLHAAIENKEDTVSTE